MDATNPRLSFPRSRRIARKADFARIYREGSRARGRLLTVAVLPNGRPHSRLGLSVGKRCWRTAVRRNRVRRIFREAFRLSLPALPAGIDVIAIASTPAISPGLEETRQELLALVPKALQRWREKAAAAGQEDGP
ncbi:MAG: ribonuclease P protein component [Planctomycetota bacterium]